MKLIVISQPSSIPNEHGIINALFEAGLNYFHLRKPDFNFEEMEEYIKLIPVQFQNKVVLHSHHQLALECGLRGIHYTKQNPYNVGNEKNLNMHQSVSFHSLGEIKNVNPVFQYVFISPVFDSISKENYKTKIDKTALKLFLQDKVNEPEIIALGGINEETINEAMEIGFDGLAVLGAIWMSNNPIEKFNHLLKITNSFNKIKNRIHV